MTSGILTIHILEAKLTRDTETFGKMDPYVVINTRQQRIRTKTMQNAGKNPKWSNEFFKIDVKYIGDDMHLEVFDEDVCDSDLVGETTIKLTSFCMGQGCDDWFQINFKGKKAGTIHLKSIWQPSGQALVARPAQQMMAPPPITFCNGQPAQHLTTKAQTQFYIISPP
jgi:Ca2+-dependent lipid-binding protein